MVAIETDDKGSEYREMMIKAVEKQSGAAVGACLTCGYTQAKGGYEFFMWTGGAPAGQQLHTLLARETSQERLDSHWQGYVANLAQLATPALAPSHMLASADGKGAEFPAGGFYGPITAISDTEVIQHIGRGKTVAWLKDGLSGDTFKIDDLVQIDAGGKVQVARGQEKGLCL